MRVVVRSSDAVRSLAREHPGLKDLLATGGPEWHRLLVPPSTPTSWPRTDDQSHRIERPDVVITGIPRSGTSLLCRLLHDLPDCVVVNEPAEIFEPLTQCENPYWLALFYRDLRQKIQGGEEIENKLAHGRVVEDTSVHDARVRYRPSVGRPDFLLGTQNTLAYLARLRVIMRAMPNAPVVLCIRHPLDTIASWKWSFSHLREVRLQDFPVAYCENPFLTGVERRRLQAIAETESVAVRRALLWAHLAETVIEHAGHVVLIRYEDLVAAPDTELARILAARVPLERSRPPITLQPRSHRGLLDQADLDAVSDLCRSPAAELGFSMTIGAS
jgi:hypothetical protein